MGLFIQKNKLSAIVQESTLAFLTCTGSDPVDSFTLRPGQHRQQRHQDELLAYIIPYQCRGFASKELDWRTERVRFGSEQQLLRLGRQGSPKSARKADRSARQHRISASRRVR
jgi:hypothetical protein